MKSNEKPSLKDLTPRQLEVLEAIASGLTTKQIAAKLGLGVKTIETHRAAIMQRTKLRTIAALVLFAIREGLIQP